MGKTFSMIVVFLISAIFHEWVASDAIGRWTYWAFLAMMI